MLSILQAQDRSGKYLVTKKSLGTTDDLDPETQQSIYEYLLVRLLL